MIVKRMKTPLYITVSLLFGFKTYIIYRFLFTIELANVMQELILLINPFASSFFVFAMSVWFKKSSRQMAFLRYTALVGSLILYFNLVFYRSFTDFITVPQIFQTSNIADVGTSILSLVKIYDIFLFLDVIIVWYFSKKKKTKYAINYTKRKKAFVLTLSFILVTGNFLLAEMERPQLFTRAFDREYLVKNIGLFNYHIYDIAIHSKVKTERVFADGNELPEIIHYINNDIRSDETSELFGVAEDKNIIFILAESLQSFVLDNDVNGQTITPFLNALKEDDDTYYFENFYHQTEQGKTSDSEFLTENSLYPGARGAVFFTHGDNEYHAMPEMLEEKDYITAVFHANNKSFWNRDQMYESLHIDRFFAKDAYDITEEYSVGWGLKDKAFFKQSMKYLQQIDEPFYAKFITLTNHFPFELEKEDRSIAPYNSTSDTLNNYFPTVRYMDEAIEEFFNHLKGSSLYEDSIIIIMGDHDGISANHNDEMSIYLNKSNITPFDYIQLQRVPLLIHIPGHEKGEIISKVAGQIDLKPTLLHMVGIETDQDIYFGNDLFHDDRKGYVACRNGDFVSNDYVSTSDICYDRKTGEKLGIESEDSYEKTPCSAIKAHVEKELGYSDAIIYGDLFRFIDF